MKRKVAIILIAALLFTSLFGTSAIPVYAEEQELTDHYSSDTLLAEYSTAEITAMYPELSEYLAQEIRNLNEDISMEGYNITKDIFGDIYFSVMCENPDIFYAFPNTAEITSNASTDLVLAVRPDYFFDLADIPAKIEEFDKNCDIILSGVDQIWDDITKARYVHDILAQYCEYDTKYETINDDDYEVYKVQMRIYTAYGAIVDNNAVCEGYSMAYKYLLEKIGIKSHYVQSIEKRHSWNIIEIDGENYHVDVAHDDPTPDNLGRVYHKYFMKSDESFKNDEDEDHTNWITNLKANDPTYDNMWWNNIGTIIYHFGDYDYYVNQHYGSSFYAAFIKRNIITGTETVLVLTKTRWKVKDMEGYFWEWAHSYLACDGTYFYYNDTSKVYRMEINGTTPETVYTKPSDISNDIYGLAFKWDGHLRITIKESPNLEDVIYKLDITENNYSNPGGNVDPSSGGDPSSSEPNPTYIISESGVLSYYLVEDANLMIPDTVGGITVTALADNLFSGNTELKTILLPRSIQSIGARAFYNCTSLTSINMPEQLTQIGVGAFSGCTSLEELTIEKTVTNIGKNAFSGCINLTIKGYKGTVAQSYAEQYKIHFVIIDPDASLPVVAQGTSIYIKKKISLTPSPKDTYKYTSSKTAVATVSSKGIITAKKAGKTVITAKGSKVIFKITLTVKNPKLSVTKKTLKKGKSFTLKVTGAVGTVKYKTSNKKIVTITSKGKIKAKKKGKATITVTASGIKLTCKITVK